MIYVKIHKGPKQVVAVCDKELIGKVFSEGKFELKISEFFYKGRELSENEVSDIMESADNLNIVGEKSINLAIKLGIVDEKNIIKVGNVKHAQVISC